MAEQQKEKGLMKILAKEYRYEGLILLVLGLVVVVLGTLILTGIATDGKEGLVVNENFFFLGEYPLAFAWILIIVGAIGIILAIGPYYKPSISEVKKVTWPSKKEMLKNSLITLAFIAIIALLFVGYDAILTQVVKLFKWFAGVIR